MWPGKILFNRQIRPLHFHLALRLPVAFADPQPGQFVMLRPAQDEGPLLSRPFSIYHFTRENQGIILEILYRVVGRGTEIMSSLTEGTAMRLLGPLGHGFRIDERRRSHILIAGGMGIAPIAFLAVFLSRRLTAENRTLACLGARNCDELLNLEKFENLRGGIHIATDDGTLGRCGVVTDLLPDLIKDNEPSQTSIYACGPVGMLKSLANCLAQNDSVSCQISVEARMACGVGACLGCVIPLVGNGNEIVRKSVCKYGPVFNLWEVCWELL